MATVGLISLYQLVTYSQLSRQWTKWQLDVAEKKVDSSSVQYPLFCMDWYRIILEESHSIRRWDAKSPGKHRSVRRGSSAGRSVCWRMAIALSRNLGSRGWSALSNLCICGLYLNGRQARQAESVSSWVTVKAPSPTCKISTMLEGGSQVYCEASYVHSLLLLKQAACLSTHWRIRCNQKHEVHHHHHQQQQQQFFLQSANSSPCII